MDFSISLDNISKEAYFRIIRPILGLTFDHSVSNIVNNVETPKHQRSLRSTT